MAKTEQELTVELTIAYLNYRARCGSCEDPKDRLEGMLRDIYDMVHALPRDPAKDE